MDRDTDTRSGSVNGAHSDQSNITLDGVDVNDQGNGYAFTSVLPVTLDSVQEFRVSTTNYNADQDRYSRAQVSLVKKSGTNSFHGSAYEYNRNTATSANDYLVKHSQLDSDLPWNYFRNMDQGITRSHDFQMPVQNYVDDLSWAKGLQFDINYTFSKSLDLSSDAGRVGERGGLGGQVIDSWSPYQLKAVSDFDTPHQFNANLNYILPFGRGMTCGNTWSPGLDALPCGWQIAGLVRLTSGFPGSVSNGYRWPTNWQLGGDAYVTGPIPAGRVKRGDRTVSMFTDQDKAIAAFDAPYPGDAGARNVYRLLQVPGRRQTAGNGRVRGRHFRQDFLVPGRKDRYCRHRRCVGRVVVCGVTEVCSPRSASRAQLRAPISARKRPCADGGADEQSLATESGLCDS